MKKKLALLLAGLMVVAMVPMNAFAASEARVTRVINLAEDEVSDAVDLVIRDHKGDIHTAGATQTFELELTNAEWEIDEDDPKWKDADGYWELGPGASLTPRTDRVATVTLSGSAFNAGGAFAAQTNGELVIPLMVKATGTGEATVRINPLGTTVSATTLTFANVADGDVTISIEKLTDINDSGSFEIKPILIDETVAGTIKNDEEVTIKLGGSFVFDIAETEGNLDVDFVTGTGDIKAGTVDCDDDELTFEFENLDGNTRFYLSGISIKNDDAVADEIAELTIRGAGINRTTIEVAKFVDYGLTLEVEDEDLPVFYSGTYEDNEVLMVTFKENAEDSWWAQRKTTFTLPEGVKFVNGTLDLETKDNVTLADGRTAITEADFEISKDGRTLEISNLRVEDTKKAKLEFTFEVSVSPEFTGDIELTVDGPGVDEPMTVVVATAELPYVITAEPNEVAIDYRNVTASDVYITEAYAGAFKRDTTIALMVDHMDIEDGVDVEVTEGDIKIENIDVDDGLASFDIRSESSREPSTIKISNIQLYLNRSLPVGDYGLYIYAPNNRLAIDQYTFFQNCEDDVDDYDFTFDVEKVNVIPDYVEVITAGRDQDESTFTTTVSVTIGAYEMQVGNKTVALDVPAYISNGYTMMPVRAVTEALSGSAIIRWDDATRTVVITFGSRIISMTVGSNIMTVNGVNVYMSAAPEIVDSRTFLPLRDLGYALGLNESKINWDDATKTATLN